MPGWGAGASGCGLRPALPRPATWGWADAGTQFWLGPAARPGRQLCPPMGLRHGWGDRASSKYGRLLIPLKDLPWHTDPRTLPDPPAQREPALDPLDKRGNRGGQRPGLVQICPAGRWQNWDWPHAFRPWGRAPDPKVFSRLIGPHPSPRQSFTDVLWLRSLHLHLLF